MYGVSIRIINPLLGYMVQLFGQCRPQGFLPELYPTHPSPCRFRGRKQALPGFRGQLPKHFPHSLESLALQRTSLQGIYKPVTDFPDWQRYSARRLPALLVCALEHLKQLHSILYLLFQLCPLVISGGLNVCLEIPTDTLQ